MSQGNRQQVEHPNRIPFTRLGKNLGDLVRALEDGYPIETKKRPAHAARTTFVEFCQNVTALIIKVTWREPGEPDAAGTERQASYQVMRAVTATMSVAMMLNPEERTQLASRILGVVGHVSPVDLQRAPAPDGESE